jgi:hypothetical protein
MRTVIVQGIEELPDGSRRQVEVTLILELSRTMLGGSQSTVLSARVSSEGEVQTGTGVG